MVTRQELSRGAALIVEDDEHMRALVGVLARQFGFDRVVGAATPQAALDRIRFDSFALALVDLALGGADGLALIRAFRASPNPHLQSLPIVVVSRCADEGVVRCALDAGADGFVAKPPTIASFNRQVSCALSKRAAANVFELE